MTTIANFAILIRSRKEGGHQVERLFYAGLLVFFVWLETPVEAYLDPGSGSMLLQILLGGVASIAVIGKLYWNRVTSLFNRKDAPKDGD